MSHEPESDFYTPLSISGRFITDPIAHGNWPNLDGDASRRATLALYGAPQGGGGSPYGRVTLDPQPPSTNIPGTALGSFGLRGGDGAVRDERTDPAGRPEADGMLSRQVGLTGIVDALTDGTFDDIDSDRYGDIPLRVDSPN